MARIESTQPANTDVAEATLVVNMMLEDLLNDISDTMERVQQQLALQNEGLNLEAGERIYE